MSQQHFLQEQLSDEAFQIYKSEKYQDYKNKYEHLGETIQFELLVDDWNELTKEEKYKYLEQHKNALNQAYHPKPEEEEKNEGSLQYKQQTSQKLTDKTQEKVTQKLAIVINNQEKQYQQKEQDQPCNKICDLNNFSGNNSQKGYYIEKNLSSNQIILDENGKQGFLNEEIKHNEAENNITLSNERQRENEQTEDLKVTLENTQKSVQEFCHLVIKYRRQIIKQKPSNSKKNYAQLTEILQLTIQISKYLDLLGNKLDKQI